MNETVLKYFKLFGQSTMSYSVIADDNIHHYYLSGRGIAGYCNYKNLRIMLGNPLCDRKYFHEIIEGFIDESNQAGKSVIGIQSNIEIAKTFHDFGYSANHMGVETILDLEKYDLRGKGKTRVRRWINTAINADVHVKENKFSEIDVEKI